ncbi:MAG: hypothetical protein WAY02_08540 [Burkholderiaceae bacterium]
MRRKKAEWIAAWAAQILTRQEGINTRPPAYAERDADLIASEDGRRILVVYFSGRSYPRRQRKCAHGGVDAAIIIDEDSGQYALERNVSKFVVPEGYRFSPAKIESESWKRIGTIHPETLVREMFK